jgi:CRISPR-associated endonuclease/helicase Cas3
MSDQSQHLQPPLSLDDFDSFVQSLTGGNEPFPWQRELARRVLDGGWQAIDTISVPTGCGKTMVLAVQAFALAANSHLPLDDPRRPPLRLFFVVDRRVVVDDSARLARRIVEGMRRAELPEGARRVFEQLRGLGLSAVTLRGGLPADDTWLLVPHRPALVVSTVDQVGSKLLFRAYRASRRAAPIHAGLVGYSSLVVLDEAHLSRPFWETIGHARRLGADIRVVAMSATPPAGTSSPPVTLEEPDWAHDVLKDRLEAAKLARLEEIASSGSPQRDQERLVARIGDLTETALETCERTVPLVVGVIVNTVARARAVFRAVAGKVGSDAHFLLLTGRTRPFDRDRLLREWLPFFSANLDRPEPPEGKPIVLISTQTLEAGADVDLDHLITESAPLDCLRQRFGRLDRLGRRHRAKLKTTATIVHVVPPAKKDQPRGLEDAWDDPIYGEATRLTWAQLLRWGRRAGRGRGRGTDGVDFGLRAMRDRLDDLTRSCGEALAPLCAPATRAPVLFPAHLDALSSTTIHPGADPAPAVFLHGPRSGPPEVYVVWRDWPEDAFRRFSSDERGRFQADTSAELRAVPPSAGEMLALPIGAVTAWLRAGTSRAVVTDLEGRDDDAPAKRSRRREGTSPGLPAVMGRPGEWRLAFADDIQPGDVVVIPCGYGGADRFGWNPDPGEKTPVQDVAVECLAEYRQRPAVRLSREAVQYDGDGGVDVLATRRATGERSGAEVGEWIGTARLVLRPPSLGGGLFFISQRRVARQDSEAEPDVPDQDNPDDLSFTGSPMPLGGHCTGVAKRALAFAEGLGLTEEEQNDLRLAGLLHDLGKADRRFQLKLHSGNEVALAAALASGRILAKSAQDAENVWPRPSRPPWDRWPEGLRHEFLSAQLLLANAPAWKQLAHDPQLVLWLVGTHHGLGRPWWPDFTDPQPTDVTVRADWIDGGPTFSLEAADRTRLDLRRLDKGWCELSSRLIRRYGWWKLATFEAVLRLADHRQSEAERAGS